MLSLNFKFYIIKNNNDKHILEVDNINAPSNPSSSLPFNLQCDNDIHNNAVAYIKQNKPIISRGF